MTRARRPAALLVLALALAAACSGTTPAVPAAATPTAVPTPLATPSPSPTPTPLAVRVGEDLPAGQLFFGVARDGKDEETVWLHLPGRQPGALFERVAPGLWDCAAGAVTRCLAVAQTNELVLWQAGSPIRTLTLPEDAGEVSVPVAAVALAPNAALAAVSWPDHTSVFDVDQDLPLASIDISRTTALAWSPDSRALALVYGEDGQAVLALWQVDGFGVQVLARQAALAGEDLAWAPDSQALAFSAQSAGGGSDVFVAFLGSGEIDNVSQMALLDQDLDPADARWAWRPAWRADGRALQYRRGLPDDPEGQEVVLHPLAQGWADPLGPASGEGLLGVILSPDGRLEARVVAAATGQAVQVRPAGGAWEQVISAGAPAVQALAWLDEPQGGTSGRLLVVEAQALWWLDAETGVVHPLDTICAACRFSRALWLP